MMYLKKFEEVSKANADIAGGKGASLGEMTQAGIPVPPGFVILADSFRGFIKANKLDEKIADILKTVNQKDTDSVDRASEQIRDLIRNAPTPSEIDQAIIEAFEALDTEFVAVRSSATAEDSSDASWAGELETYLNTHRENLLEAVKKCWSSLFTSRAIFYRIEKQMTTTDVAVAVVVQKMVNSEVAGIAFTVHPVTKDPNSMVIEAGWGLGETIVGGQITPDTYIIDKSNHKISDIYPSDQDIMLVREGMASKEIPVPQEKEGKRKLNNEEILELAMICINIEEHYGFPCDIEWARENNAFYMVQSRPITTL